MDAIGGYFGLELKQGDHYHKNALRLNTARNCFEYVLRVRNYKKVYIPYYTCEVILEPLEKLNIEYEFYHINELLEPKSEYSLKENEAFLYTNYFGLKQDCVKRLAKLYNKQLIVDNAQAFYAEPLVEIDTFYSPRKFFGVADGGYLYIDQKLDIELDQDYSYERMSHLLKRIDVSAEFGYNDFKRNDDSLINQPIKLMSNLTNKILSSIDYNSIKSKRIENYLYLDSKLKDKNLIQLTLNNNDVPMVYPYLCSDKELKNKLISNKIFVATYWPNVFDWTKEEDLEYNLAKQLLPLPIDQRYNIKRLEIIKINK
ncbi:MAG: hypothetical protein EOM29_04340 [Bacteroidia bacterium]|nr:hypothetical protein [Bacteroidia bacterium]